MLRLWASGRLPVDEDPWASDAGSEELDMEEDVWAGFDHMEPARNPNEFLRDLLGVDDVVSSSGMDAYLRTGVSRLPPVDFGSRQQQQPMQPVISDSLYRPADRVENSLNTANLTQASIAAAEAAPTAAAGYTWCEVLGVGRVRVSGASLHDAGSASVGAHIQYLGDDDVAQQTDLDPKQHGPPPDMKLVEPPSIVDTVRLFTLSTEQAFAFVQLADALLLEKQGQKLQQPLRMVLTGEPGTGKSQVLKAFLWFALQYDASHLILVAAFQWRAALHVATGRHPAKSTCKAFSIGMTYTFGDCSEFVDGVRFVFLDEYSFINCHHLNLISQSIRSAQGLCAADGRSFGDMNVVLSGDLCQHKPVGGRPLFANDDERRAYNQLLRARGVRERPLELANLKAPELAGITAYRMFDRVVFLQQQQRIASADDKLFAYSRLFNSEERPTREVVAAFCDELNQKVVTPQLLEQWAADGGVPRVVCLRNEMRKHLNWHLGSLHAKHVGIRPVVWFAKDSLSAGRGKKMPADPAEAPPLPRKIRDAVALLNMEDTEHVPGVQMFFPGCRYTFTKNPAASLGFVNNAECVGVDVLLAPGEADDGEHACWFLKRPPVAIFVRPLEGQVSRAAWDCMRADFPTLPEGCIPLTPGWCESFQVTVELEVLHKNGTSYKPKQYKNKAYLVRRFGFRLNDAYAVTDFYCQGMSFKHARWMAHLNMPPGQHQLSRAAVFVVLTRWGEWEYVWLIAPLWPEGDSAARDVVIDQFHKLACLQVDLKAELRRLRALAARAKATYVEQWQVAVEATNSAE